MAPADEERFWSKVDKSGDCWEWAGAKLRGYGQIRVEGTLVYAHRWAFKDANGLLPPVVRHTCDNPSCVNPAHLLGGCQSDNMRDMAERGRHGHAKLTEEIVLYIRENPAGLTQDELSALSGVQQSVVSKAKLRKTWKHVV